MKNRHKYGSLLAYVDISLNLLVGFVGLFVLTLILIKTEETKQKPSVETNGKLIIHLNWESASLDDVDLWVMTNNPDVIVGFRSKDQINMVLDNDNLGANSHAVQMSDGTIKNTFGNNENVMIKECTNTTVTANLHLYTLGGGTLPIKARVTLLKPYPYSVIYTADILLSTKGQEITAFTFDIDEECNVTNITQIFTPFVYSSDRGILSPTFPGIANQ